ncbi:hypothetical protein [Pseudoroseomonas ludipueritiae]|uniref:DUF2244 domain-containing protein n=1 Tax=Pseudoroseomonas ludipueritiae TaxID=198093 RepID=A0ABR7RDI8_9PROT|nr:hypothetical protein [Pseudoroseomonas ludipueritiae]MBC9179840.1 hypothetical protein [Pseudoroseomonas ludipueritiae]
MTELEALRGMIDRGEVQLGVHIRKMNTPGSPVYRQGENVWPLSLLLVASLLGIWLVHFYVGALILAAGTIYWVMKIQPRVKQGVFERSAALALENEANFDALWAKDALTLYAKLPDGTERAAARKHDWRAFVRGMPDSGF